MAIQFKTSGTVLFSASGTVAMDAACCCEGDTGEPDTCSGCFNAVDIPSLTIDLNAAAATGSDPAADFFGCDDADCQDLTGLYVADYRLPYNPMDLVFSACDTFFSPYCIWELPLSEDNSIPCVSNTFADDYYQFFHVVVGKDSSTSEWFVAVFLSLFDHVVSPAGYVTKWKRSLGSTKPNCLTGIFPITLDAADYCEPPVGEGISRTCTLDDISMTVDIT